jgi:hypothetical protein
MGIIFPTEKETELDKITDGYILAHIRAREKIRIQTNQAELIVKTLLVQNFPPILEFRQLRSFLCTSLSRCCEKSYLAELIQALWTIFELNNM